MCKIWEEVHDEGVKEGAKGKLLENIKTLMDTMNLTVDQAMDALRVPAEDRSDVKRKIVLP